MRKVLATSLLGGLLFLGSAGLSRSETTRFEALFCPECWEYLWGPGAVDMRGNCGGCGKHPVEIEATPMSWWWCAREKKWRRAACAQSRLKKCCVGEESLALRVAPGSEVFEAWYCPSHRAFYVYRIPILSRWVCRTCAKPAVKVDAMERAWYWCATDGGWGMTPCPLNPTKKCCTKHSGILLVKPEPGPIAK